MKTIPLILFWSLGIIWGSNFIYMKWASEYIDTSQIVLLRVMFGFFPVLIYSIYRKELSISHLKSSFHFFVMSLIATSIYYYGYSKGSELLLSGVAGALSGAIPIFSFIVACIFLPDEKISAMRSVGIILGFLGVLLIANPFTQDIASTNIEGIAYMIIGSLSVGVSFIYAKKYILPLNIPSSASTTYQLGFALILLSVLTEFKGIENIFISCHVAMGLFLGLGVLGTGIAYVIYYYLIEHMGAVSASSVTYIPPVIALIIGAIFVKENIVIQDYLAVLCIFAGVVLIRKV